VCVTLLGAKSVNCALSLDNAAGYG
jgi:hypothetical protein